MPPTENVHWLFGVALLFLGLCLLAEAVVGTATWRVRWWRAYLAPVATAGVGLAMWPVTVLFPSSTIHLAAHAVWAQSMMIAGLAELGLLRGALRGRGWSLCLPVGLALSGTAFLVHEQNPWLFERSAFLHHLIGWTLIVGALFPLVATLRPSAVWRAGLAVIAIAVSVMLFSDRDAAPIFGHFSPLAERPVP